MIVLIDNYDSFTFNLFHYLGGLGADVAVYRNDKITADRVMTMDPDAIVLSPGPCTPNDAGICLELIAKAAQTVPVLGVCLGHQAIGQAFGGDVVRAPVQCSAASMDGSRPHATIRWWSNGRPCPRNLR
jgi:anthranilate synthase component 2